MAKKKTIAEPEKKKKGGFVRFCKGVFTLISLVAIAGCGFFGYMYFKDRMPVETLSFEQAKELVYTAAYDSGIIDASVFRQAIQKDPLARPVNLGSEESFPLPGYGLYGDEQVYSSDTAWMQAYIIEEPTLEYFDRILEFFSIEGISEGKHYKIENEYKFIYSYRIEKNSVIASIWYGTGSYDDTEWSSYEYVYKLTLNEKSKAGIESYDISRKSIQVFDDSSELVSFDCSVEKWNDRYVTKNNAAYIYTRANGFTSANELESFVQIQTLGVDLFGVDIVENTIYQFKNTQQTYKKAFIEQAIDVFVEDANLHLNALDYYNAKAVTDLTK